MITGRFVGVDGLDRHLAEAAEAEHRLDHDDAAEQRADVDAELGDDRGQRGPHAVPVDHPALGQALGPGGPDVVLAERLEQLSRGSAGCRRRPGRPRG